MKRPLLVFAAMALAFQPAVAAKSTEPATITFINCPAGLLKHDPIDVYVGDIQLRRDIARVHVATNGMRPIQTITLKLPQGSFFISVSNHECGDEFHGVVVSGHRVSLVAIARRDFIYIDYRGTTASGSLPYRGFFASIVYIKTNFSRGSVQPETYDEIPAYVSGKTFYATNLHPGHALLRLYNTQMTNWLDFDLGEIKNIPGKSRTKIFNVTEQMLVHAARFPERTLVFNVPAQTPNVTPSPAKSPPRRKE